MFAVTTYFTVSACFWYIGLVPDFATPRDRATVRWRQLVYGILSLGWRGSTAQWQPLQPAYLFLAALATPLVLSVHTVVSWDFAVSHLPGWHTTIFAPYFVAGAIFSGCAMVLTSRCSIRADVRPQGRRHAAPLRQHGEAASCSPGMIVGYAYGMEFFIGVLLAASSTSATSSGTASSASTGGPAGCMITCNAIIPQLLWFKRSV